MIENYENAIEKYLDFEQLENVSEFLSVTFPVRLAVFDLKGKFVCAPQAEGSQLNIPQELFKNSLAGAFILESLKKSESLVTNDENGNAFLAAFLCLNQKRVALLACFFDGKDASDQDIRMLKKTLESQARFIGDSIYDKCVITDLTEELASRYEDLA